MIFVTVGTHEQQFDRLIQYIDGLKLEEEVILQTGYSTYIPKNYHYQKMMKYDEMIKYVEEASIIITHGGPSSIMLPIQYGKVPIVVPRQHQFGEHVNNHQVDFTKRLETEKMLIAVYDISELSQIVNNYYRISGNLMVSKLSNTENFNKQLIYIVDSLFYKKRNHK